MRVDCVAAVELQCLALVANVSSPFASRLGASKASRYEIPIAGGRGLLVENGAADVALRLSNPSAYTVFELDTAGNRLSEIPSRAADGSLRFTVSTCGKSGGRIYYEICRPREHD